METKKVKIKKFPLSNGKVMYLPEKPGEGAVILTAYQTMDEAARHAENKSDVYKIVVSEGVNVGLIVYTDVLGNYIEMQIEVDIRNAKDCNGFHLI
ncbi:MAG: hypothetical protein IJJ61_06430 [Clostridia bacterium]|nr:hypothetical protein [Clostridia bacterium]